MNEDQFPPNSPESERGVLGCLLLDCEAVLPELSSLPPEAFFDLRHRKIFEVSKHLAGKSLPVNSLTVKAALADQGDQVDIAFLMDLEGCAPSAHNLTYHLPTLLEKHLRRRILKGCSIIAGKASNGSDMSEVLSVVQAMLNLERPGSVGIQDGNASGDRLVNDLERRHQLDGALSGLDTGFWKLNQLTNGLQFGEQTLIGARPSQGKTALGLQMFVRTVFHHEIPALFVTLEMSTEALMRRMMAMQTGISLADIRRGSYTEGDFAKFTNFRVQCGRKPMRIVDGVAGMAMSDVVWACKKAVRKHGVKLIVVDYLQKIRPDHRHEKRTYEVAEVSERLKAIAFENNVALLTLAQLNRESERDKGRIPRVSDLADSGQIERDADTVMLLHRDRSDQTKPAQVIVGKQRDGATGIVALDFNPDLVCFEEMKAPATND